MTSASMRMLMILLFAAAVVNFTNYAFCWLYSSPSRRARAQLFKKITSPRTSFTTKATPLIWSGKLVCEDKSSPGLKQAVDGPNEGEDYSARAMTSSVLDYFISGNNKDVCPEVPPYLGPEKVTANEHRSNLDKVKPELRQGGIYKPTDCTPRQSVAVIVPCSDCQETLHIFLGHLHPILIKQQLDFQIFVIEQSNASLLFNRGKVLNIGYAEAQNYRSSGWRCVVFHEPYLLPVDSRNLYRCSWYPRQLATFVQRIDKSSYFAKFGGAIAISSEQFVMANGFSNLYWGSDADYHNMHRRLLAANLTIERSPQSVGKYKSLKAYEIPSTSMRTTPSLPYTTNDGLSTLSYSVDSVEFKSTHTHIAVSIDASATELNSWEKIRNQVTTKPTLSQRNTRANA